MGVVSGAGHVSSWRMALTTVPGFFCCIACPAAASKGSRVT
ncbi:hypothetical protein [Synechococcus sp. MU1643]|nr:hypothetical protein [Synechococcus sp. MU1643]